MSITMSIMFDPIKQGEHIPDVRLSRLDNDGKTVINFSTKTELSDGLVALFSMPIAFSQICDHFPGMVKAAEAFKNLDVKMYCVAVNTQHELFAWGLQHDPEHHITLIPDRAGDFVFLSRLGIDTSEETLGFVARRAALLLYNGKVLDIQIEEDAEKYTTKSSVQGLLKRIPSILKANNISTKAAEVLIEKPAIDILDVRTLQSKI